MLNPRIHCSCACFIMEKLGIVAGIKRASMRMYVTTVMVHTQHQNAPMKKEKQSSVSGPLRGRVLGANRV